MTSNMILGYFLLPALAFAVAYFPIMKIVRSVGAAYPKADLRRRFLAAGVDSVLLLMPWLYFAKTGSAWFLVAGAAFLFLRDGMKGRSPGKFLCGLVAIDLETKEPVGLLLSARRNLVFAIPGVNIAAVLLETIAIVRDPQGQRLGDRLAFTQVVDGFGVKDLAESFVEWLAESGVGVMNGPVKQPQDGTRQFQRELEVEIRVTECQRYRRERRLTRRCSGRRPNTLIDDKGVGRRS